MFVLLHLLMLVLFAQYNQHADLCRYNLLKGFPILSAIRVAGRSLELFGIPPDPISPLPLHFPVASNDKITAIINK